MKTLQCKLVGVDELLMHNGLLADPAYPWTVALKKITSKRKKSTADYEEMARLEWHGSLYLDDDKRPSIPDIVIEGTLLGRGGAARLEKMGKIGAAGVWVKGMFPLNYDDYGVSADLDEMWESGKFRFDAMVKVQMSRVKRCRPIFRNWSAIVQISYNEVLVDPDILKRWLVLAGAQVGLMDWRPKYGRFTVQNVIENVI